MPTLAPLNPAAAVAALRAGELVAHSTSSLCGITVDPRNPSGLDALDALKRRGAGAGYVHVVARAADAQGWAGELALAQRVWDTLLGPTTLILPAGPGAPARCLGPDHTLALRRDPHPHVAALSGRMGHPLVSTSLNLPGEAPASLDDDLPPELARALAGRLLTAHSPQQQGAQGRGKPSTLLRYVEGDWQVLRQGWLTQDALDQLRRLRP